jgi:hypothetical protein
MKSSDEENQIIVEGLHPLMKGLSYSLLVMIPVLAYFILRTDPVIYSNNIQADEQTLSQVKTFASFIQTRPELTKIKEIQKPEGLLSARKEEPRLPPISKLVMSTEDRDQVRVIQMKWDEGSIMRNEVWSSEVELLLKIAEKTPDESVLDLLNQQITGARSDTDDLVRERADQWFPRYLKLEKRATQRERAVDFYRENVLKRVDEDERTKEVAH